LKHGANGNIENSSCRLTSRSGSTQELFIDSYPVAAVSRALIPPGPSQTNGNPGGMPESNARPRARYEYAVGPDGGVGLYSILYAPPAPYCVGNLIHEPWSAVAQRVGRDPIAITIQQEGLEPIVSFMDESCPSLQQSLAQHFHSIQQYLYLCLLDCDRRLLLNAWLLARLQTWRRLVCEDRNLRDRLHRLLAAPEHATDLLPKLYGPAARASAFGAKVDESQALDRAT
jgi:hypothetical protein